MDFNEIISLIGNLGFPIAAYILLFVQTNKKIEKLTEVVNNNTSILNKLLERMNND